MFRRGFDLGPHEPGINWGMVSVTTVAWEVDMSVDMVIASSRYHGSYTISHSNPRKVCFYHKPFKRPFRPSGTSQDLPE